jgi:hypothetical protein
MAGQRSSHDLDSDFRATQAIERDRLVLDLKDRVARLNDQARIFIPLIALCLIVAMPIWSKSLSRFLILLLSPFVLLPLGFCLVHLLLSWRGIAKARTRLRDLERIKRESDAIY